MPAMLKKGLLFSFRDIGPRSKVWTEKEFIDKAAEEFSQVFKKKKKTSIKKIITLVCRYDCINVSL